MHAGIAAETFEAARDGEEFLDVDAFVDEFFDVGDFYDIVEVDVGAAGDELGDFVGFGDGHAEHAADVFNCGLRSERVERDDLADVAVFVADVVDDFAAAFLADVDVDIGHGGAVGVHEAFEEEIVFEGIDVAEGEDVADEGADAGTSGPDGDAILFGEVAEVPDDEEVAGEAFGADDLEFVVEALHEFFVLVFGDVVAELFCEAGETELADVGVGGVGDVGGRGGRRRGEDGGVASAEVELQLALFGDAQGIVAGLGDFAENLAHLGGAFEVELGGIFEAGLVGDGAAHADAAKGVMGVVIVFEEKVMVVGGHQRATGTPRDFDELGDQRDLGGIVVVLQFDVEVVAEDILVLAGDGDRAFHVAFFEHGGDFGAEVAVDDDEAFVVFGEGFLVDARAVVEALGVGEGGELEDVFPADFVFDDDGEVIGGFGDAVGVFVEAGVWGDVEFAADDAFDVEFLGGGVPFDSAEEVAVIGECDGGHGELFGFF